ncbi:hypothetical protein W97_02122 [Coniosporium apollinis CBS 100218]|uniref:Uncharacterized protein n=1 Tax=Coniosporium apollinis (strain CBS 100218) TaxID=1168221 RepID=R7YLV1_CONA1|nr:uncharacterized protein W97_02122 [Coniosporium apollinis CBS 100218]EON62897.1 hypothetical protein W97_02122 [Coniosporium apollinis CBS 100218]
MVGLGNMSIAHLHYNMDEDLVEAFTRLDVQASSYVARRAPAITRQPVFDSSSVFVEVNNAEEHLYQELNCVWSFLRNTAEDYRYREANLIPLDVLAQAQSIQSRLRQWETAFMPFWAVYQSETSEGAHQAKLLRIYHDTATVLMADALHPVEVVFDAFDDTFRRIVLLSEELLRKKFAGSSANTFSIEMGIVYPLYLTAVKCRIVDLRAKAIQLLLSVPQPEGIWDGRVMAKIAEQVKQIEEEGLHATFLNVHRVPEFRRVHAIGIDIDAKARTAEFSCKLRPNGPDGEWEERKHFVRW